MYLEGVERKAPALRADQFPWSLPLFARLNKLEIRAPVTFLVGENGSGKSTLLEGLAVGVQAIAAGSQELARDETLWAAHEFARAFRFIRRRHPKRTMFMRAEDVLGYKLTAARLYKEGAIARAGGLKALDAARAAEEQEEAADIA
ncbi:MAG TPA: AAA family ATPase, partial [Terracidiphilus sp.]|nr:AAA family ATPase [Terracidiphilus sp.]